MIGRISVKTLFRRFAMAIAVVVVIFAVAGIFSMLYSYGVRLDQQDRMRQKTCWNDIYTIIEKSPREKADWIRQTISHQASLLRRVDYCSALDFIKNGQEGK